MIKLVIILAAAVALVPSLMVIIAMAVLRKDIRKLQELKNEVTDLRIQLHTETHIIQDYLSRAETRAKTEAKVETRPLNDALSPEVPSRPY